MNWLYKLTGTSDFRSLAAHLMSHDADPVTQFIKYGLAGGVATLTHILIFALCNETVFPAAAALAPRERAINYFISNAIAFLFSNTVAYLINVKFVFKPGRHHRVLEFFLFLSASLLAFFVGTPLGSFIVAKFAINEYIAFGATIATSVLVNYTCRKFIIFKG